MNYSPLSVPEAFYHVYNRGNSYEKLFLNNENYRFFYIKCQNYLSSVSTIYAYSLLPNHFHLLIKTHSSENIKLNENVTFSSHISKTFSNLFNSYTKSFNQYHHRRGTLFSQPFKRKQIDSKDYLKNVVQYIHQNP